MTTLSPGETGQLLATTLDAQGGTLSGRTVTWNSTNVAVATVSPSGLVTGMSVGGPVTIVATSEGQDGSASVTVVPPPVASVTVAPSSTNTLTPGATVQLAATLRDAFGGILTDRTVTWSSSNPAVATVTPNGGLVTGVTSGGPVTISALSEGRTGTATVTVATPIVTTVTVSPSVASVPSGGTTPLTATVRDQNNIVLAGRTVSWTTSNSLIATVSPAGVVSGVSAGGPVTITATLDGKSGTAAVTVTSSPCDASTSIAIGQVISGTLTNTDCTLEDGSYMDLFRLPVTSAGRLQFDVSSGTFDAYLILFLQNQDGTRVAVGADNNSGGGTNARMTRDVLAGETYLIGANSLQGGVTGGYQVSVQIGAMVAGALSQQQRALNPGEEVTKAAKVRMAAKAVGTQRVVR